MDDLTAEILVEQARQKDQERKIAAGESSIGGQDFLFGVIGARLKGNAHATLANDAVPETVTTMIDSASIAAFGRNYYRRIEAALRNLLCGDDQDGKDVRKKLSEAGMNTAILSTLLTGAIATFFGTSLIIAGAVAAVVIYLFVNTGEKAICDIWK